MYLLRVKEQINKILKLFIKWRAQVELFHNTIWPKEALIFYAFVIAIVGIIAYIVFSASGKTEKEEKRKKEIQEKVHKKQGTINISGFCSEFS